MTTTFQLNRKAPKPEYIPDFDPSMGTGRSGAENLARTSIDLIAKGAAQARSGEISKGLGAPATAAGLVGLGALVLIPSARKFLQRKAGEQLDRFKE